MSATDHSFADVDSLHVATSEEISKFGSPKSDSFLTARERFHVRTPAELAERCRVIGTGSYLIDGLIPDRSITLLAGDSGLGKSALLYQLGLSVATGTPFLGRSTRSGRVLYLDYENGIGQCFEIVQRQARFLGLDGNPRNLLLWNMNDSSPQFGQKNHTLVDIIGKMRPDVAIIDSLGAWWPDIEEKNSLALIALRQLRVLIRDLGVSIIFVHHLRKRSNKADESPSSLQVDPRRWFDQVRGARALINSTDVRLGVEKPDMPRIVVPDEHMTEQPALVMQGFARVTGNVGPIFASRVFDEDGEPLGYRQMIGAQLLFHDEQEKAFARLPVRFEFKEAKRIYRRADQATRDFLLKCVEFGILRQLARGRYEKMGS
jgi:hypothetical protein